MKKSKLSLFQIFFFILLGLAGQTVFAADTIPDNSIDEDGDGWLDTTLGYQLRAAHPRVLTTPDQLQTVIDRMYGANARNPYQNWFNLVKAAEDGGTNVGLVELALLYKATGTTTYRDRFLSRLPSTGTPGLDELFAIDIMFDELDNAAKTNIMQRVANAGNDIWYYASVTQSNSVDANWGYHSAIGVSQALAYAGIFAFTDLELDKNPVQFPFNANNYLALTMEELSPTGNFYHTERRVGGDPTFNDALPGSFGGMYDNFGYDGSEESFSIDVLLEFRNLTGQDRTDDFLHDKYRGSFYQNMHYPYIYTTYSSDQWCRRAGTESHALARVWNTQTDWSSQPTRDTVPPLSSIYQDGRVQYYANNGENVVLCGSPYDGIFWFLLYYDDTLDQILPSSNPTATYFNGPGLVSMRSDWSNDAAFAVFIAGEGISRRYEDANSFLMGRKTDVFPHGGARIRNNFDNGKHHWYHIRSAAKNTLKIYDPLESFDINPTNGTITALHTGTQLVQSDNLGGQIFETEISSINDSYNGLGTARYNCSGYPLDVCETANVTKYEHDPDHGYTYTVGDGTEAYTKKIDYFEREFFYLRPDVFVIFDRVKSVNSNYRKVWTVHTVDEPVTSGPLSESDLGMKSYQNASLTTISNAENITYINTLLPGQNRVVNRGGDTVLVNDQTLNASNDISAGEITLANTDIPRWLELLGSGSDATGSLTIYGDAQEGNGVTETVTFDGVRQSSVSSRPTAMTVTTLTDTTQSWTVGQWANYMVRTSCGSNSYTAVITGNDEDTLYTSNFPSTSCWGYEIFRYVENSYNHWTRIDHITTTNLDLQYLRVSVPHYFDTEGANGSVYSFSPHTDTHDDQYQKREDIGQWTVNIEATEPSLLDNFLNVIELKDPEVEKQETHLIEGTGVSGALVGSTFLVFANEQTQISNTQFQVPTSGSVNGFVADLIPEHTYYYSLSENNVSLSSTDNGGVTVQSSAMGVARFQFNLFDSTDPAVPTGLNVN